MAYVREPRPDYGLGFQVKVLKTLYVDPSHPHLHGRFQKLVDVISLSYRLLKQVRAPYNLRILVYLVIYDSG